MSDEELTKLFEGYGWHPMIVQGDGPRRRAGRGARHRLRRDPRPPGRGAQRQAPRAPALADADRASRPRAGPGPKEVDGIQIEGTSKAHQVPAMKAKSDPEHLKILEEWLRSYKPEELFDDKGGPKEEILACCPTGRPADGRQPARQRRQDAQGPQAARARQARARRSPSPGAETGSALGQLGEYFADIFRLNADEANFRIVCPDEVASNRLGAVFEATDHAWEWPLRPEDRHGARPRRPRHGGALRAQLPGLAAGLRAHRPPRRLPLLRGVHPDHRRDGQPVLEVPEDVEGGGSLARAGGRPQLPAHLGGLEAGPQRLLAPDAGLHQLHAQPQGGHGAGVPAAGRQHAARDVRAGAASPRARSTW